MGGDILTTQNQSNTIFFSFTQLAYGCISGTIVQSSVVDLTSLLTASAEKSPSTFLMNETKIYILMEGKKKQAIDSH
jgi:hypothetical protein